MSFKRLAISDDMISEWEKCPKGHWSRVLKNYERRVTLAHIADMNYCLPPDWESKGYNRYIGKIYNVSNSISSNFLDRDCKHPMIYFKGNDLSNVMKSIDEELCLE